MLTAQKPLGTLPDSHTTAPKKRGLEPGWRSLALIRARHVHFLSADDKPVINVGRVYLAPTDPFQSRIPRVHAFPFTKDKRIVLPNMLFHLLCSEQK
ncbi:hypothetical protein Dda3937_02607 [Dickeya dadantii 3937]|uniref:Uncharacterized protein n=1 Tax=Dickeya dadantii (strain 3937) TaxID=198628 RepID=E0SEE9_DICD3|nr:hypothetical protein Dda3937_02607 [Dickeya dadantii 3937]